MDTVDLVKEKLDIAEVVGKYVKLAPAGKNLKGRCPFHKEKTPSFVVSPDRQIWHCFGCFPPGQKVKTPFGSHNIESIDEEHLVYSGSGAVRKVLATHKRQYKGKLIHVGTYKLGGIVSMTKDHNLRVVRPKTSYKHKVKQFYRRSRAYMQKHNTSLSRAIENQAEIIEVSAGELKKGDFVLYPIPKDVSKIKELNLKDYLNRKKRFGPKPPEIKYKQNISNDFLKLLGYYIAEGSNHRAYIRFSLGNHEEDFAQDIVKLTKKLFGINASIYRRPKEGKKTGIEITACHAHLADIFENLCGKGAQNKHIPFELQWISPKKQKVLIEAIFRGDGYSYVANRSTKIHKGITTVSPTLSDQILDGLLRNNIHPSLSTTEQKTDTKGVHHKKSYTVKWSEEAEASHEFRYSDKTGEYWLVPIKSITKEAYQGPVHNLTVDKDHNYVASNFSVSNCGSGGDMLSFMMKYENIEFIEALRILADQAGVSMQLRSSQDHRQLNVLYEINNLASSFFQAALKSEKAKDAQEYLTKRGLKPETIQEFSIGLSGPSNDALIKFLTKKGYAIEDIEKAGLAFKTQRGSYWDRFQNRIMFPLFNHFGKIVGFTGRVLPNETREDVGKYVNSPETPIFNKSKLLFGFFLSKEAIRDSSQAILVEGQMDFLMMYQAGFKNVVATSGTALTVDHLKALRKIAEEVIIAFDNDNAGQLATERSIELAQKEDFNVRVADLKDAKDPADLAQSNPQELKKVLADSIPAIEYFFDYYGLSAAKDIKDKKKAIRSILARIKSISSAVEKNHYLEILSNRSGFSIEVLKEELQQVKGGEALPEKVPSGNELQEASSELKNLSSKGRILYRVFSLALSSEKAKAVLAEDESWVEDVFRDLYKTVVKNEKIELSPELKQFADLIYLQASLEPINDDNIEREIAFLVNRLKEEAQKQLRQALRARIEKAEAAGEEDDLKKALEEYNKLISSS